jgi:hypothetical protein
MTLTDNQQIPAGQSGEDAANGSSGLDDNSLQAAELRMRAALGIGGSRERAVSRPQEQQHSSAERLSRARPTGNGTRHRFVRDGEVPVVLVKRSDRQEGGGSNVGGSEVAPMTNRAAAMATALDAERAARERAERMLQEALATIRDLQTRLAHAELARIETREAFRSDTDALTSLHAESLAQEDQGAAALAVERQSRKIAEEALQDARTALGRAERRVSHPPSVDETVPVPATPLQPSAQAKSATKRAATGTEVPKATRPRKTPEPKPVRWWIKSKTAPKR